MDSSSYTDEDICGVKGKGKGKGKSKDADGPSALIRRIENTIYFSDRITYSTAHILQTMLKTCELDALEDLDRLKSVCLKEKDKEKISTINIIFEPKPILLYITTHGGLVHAALSVVDTIESLKVPVHTVVSGYVASAGTLISLAGAKRYMTPNAFMMVHEIRSGFWGKYSDARVEYENVTKLMEHIIRYYIAKTKLTREKLTEMLRTDTDLTVGECLELGLIDCPKNPNL
jgi:ATP-dependent Clp endopeptidase proteolytic subunit ClpP